MVIAEKKEQIRLGGLSLLLLFLLPPLLGAKAMLPVELGGNAEIDARLLTPK